VASSTLLVLSLRSPLFPVSMANSRWGHGVTAAVWQPWPDQGDSRRRSGNGATSAAPTGPLLPEAVKESGVHANGQGHLEFLRLLHTLPK